MGVLEKGGNPGRTSFLTLRVATEQNVKIRVLRAEALCTPESDAVVRRLRREETILALINLRIEQVKESANMVLHRIL